MIDPRLDYLVNVEGIDQATACGMLWGKAARDPFAASGAPPAPAYPTTPAEDRSWATAWIAHATRVLFADVLTWLNLRSAR